MRSTASISEINFKKNKGLNGNLIFISISETKELFKHIDPLFNPQIDTIYNIYSII